ncbi:MAG: hypothetical protein M1822_008187 [Bathelium mastoideum]|nr:MAG: hypothetical protein M1822_008187 [Bathelium mastoideum]
MVLPPGGDPYGMEQSSIVSTTFTSVTLDGGFSMATSTITTTTVSIFDTPSIVNIGGPEYVTTATDLSLTTPLCVLSIIVPQCQAQWNAWASLRVATTGQPPSQCLFTSTSTDTDKDVFTYLETISSSTCREWLITSSKIAQAQTSSPYCTQASVADPLCNNLRSNYLSSWNSAYLGAFGKLGDVESYISASNGSSIPTFEWPSSSRFAPGCSLGCGFCTITANTVQLFYWPSTNINATSTKAKREYDPITIQNFNTSFVSPTVYVYYSQIYALNSCGRAIGRTHYSTFLAISNTNELSSVWATPEINDGLLVSVVWRTAFFNFTDLNTPVPASIYDRQLWCADLAYSSLGDALTGRKTLSYGEAVTNQSFLSSCPQDRAYDPILVVPLKSVQAIDPAWSDCSFDLRDAFDPPYALRHATVVAAPTASNVVHTVPAAPASGPLLSQPAQTASTGVFTPAKTTPDDPRKTSKASGSDLNSWSLRPVDPPISSAKPPTRTVADPDTGDPPVVRPGSVKTQALDPIITSPGASENGGSKAAKGVLSIFSDEPDPSIGPQADPKATDVSDHAAGAIESMLLNTPDTSAGSVHGEIDPADPQTANSKSVTSADQSVNGGGSHESARRVSASSGDKDGDPGLVNGNTAAFGTTVATVPQNNDPQDDGLDNTRFTATGIAAGQAGTDGPFSNAPASPGPNMLSAKISGADRSGSASPDNLPVSDVTDVNAKGSNAIHPDSSIKDTTQVTKSILGAVITAQGLSLTVLQTGASDEMIIPHGSTWRTLSVNGPAATIGDQTISAVPEGVGVNGYSQHFEAIAPSTMDRVSQKKLIIPMGSSSVTLFLGGAATTLDGRVLSAASDHLFIGSSTVLYSNDPISGPATHFVASFTVAGAAYTAFETNDYDPSESDQLASSHTNAQSLAQHIAPFIVNDETYTAFETSSNGLEDVVVSFGSSLRTLEPGGPAVTIDGKALSAASNGIVIGTSTEVWTQLSDTSASNHLTTQSGQKLIAPFTVSGTAYTAIGTNVVGHSGGIVIPDQHEDLTLWPGGPDATLDGEVVSAASTGLVVGGSTKTITTVTSTSGNTWIATSASTLSGTGGASGVDPQSPSGGARDSGSRRLSFGMMATCIPGLLASWLA